MCKTAASQYSVFGSKIANSVETITCFLLLFSALCVIVLNFKTLFLIFNHILNEKF